MRIYTSQQMRNAERLAVEGGISYTRLMENAGSACARAVREIIRQQERDCRTVIVCGKGNNGGDGFVIARKLFESGCSPAVILALGRPSTEDAQTMLSMLSGLPVKVTDYILEQDTAESLIAGADVLVDAVFGIGFSASNDEGLARLFSVMSSCGGVKIAVDVPSGIESDCRNEPSVCFCADITIAVSALKPCHVLQPFARFCGKTRVVQIGVEDTFYSDAPYYAYTLNDNEAAGLFPSRNPVTNKGDYGRVLSICGCKRYVGAAFLAAMGAVRSGAGLVFAAFPDCAYPALGSKLTESPLLPLPSNTLGTLSAAAIPPLLEEIKKSDVIILGCGMGQGGDVTAVVEAVLRNADCPIILDADGINAVSRNINILKEAHAPLVLTPHPGEMARMTGLTVAEIMADRIKVARAFADYYGVTLVLKGANTVVAKSGCENVFINTTGNPGMAKGGSGDLLSGIIAGFAAQGVRDFAAAAVYLHGLCGDKAAEKLSQRGLTPSDCLYVLPEVLSKFE